LNIGGDVNISAGVFTVPKAGCWHDGIYHFSVSIAKEGYDGIYHFSVSIAKEGYSLEAIQSIQIYFRVNGNKIGMSGIGGIPLLEHL